MVIHLGVKGVLSSEKNESELSNLVEPRSKTTNRMEGLNIDSDIVFDIRAKRKVVEHQEGNHRVGIREQSVQAWQDGSSGLVGHQLER